MTEPITSYIYKDVDFNYYGKSLRFFTSRELFSSVAVDRGSDFLLQSIGRRIPPTDGAMVADIGCGIGVLGLALQARNPALRLTCADRDALALAFTQHNGRANKLPPAQCIGSLGVNGLPEKNYDLVVCNIPAKAGGPVIRAMIHGFGSVITNGKGTAAVVIVKPLAEFAEQVIRDTQGEILFRDSGSEHTVFHFRRGRPVPADLSLQPYFREEKEFTLKDRGYRIRSVYGLSEFDRLSYASELGIKLLGKSGIRGRVLFHNPGQGHVPVRMLLSRGNEISHVSISGRDLLSLFVSELNISENTGVKVDTFHIPYLGRLEKKFDVLVINYEKEAFAAAPELLWREISGLLDNDGELVLVGSSTFMFRFDGRKHPFKKLHDIKHKGFRGIHYKNP